MILCFGSMRGQSQLLPLAEVITRVNDNFKRRRINNQEPFFFLECILLCSTKTYLFVISSLHRQNPQFLSNMYRRFLKFCQYLEACV